MVIDLAFGKTGLSVDLPERFRYRVLEARSAKPLPDWQAALEAALEAPSVRRRSPSSRGANRAPPFPSATSRGPAPNRRTLPPVLRRLEEAGIPRERITILIATGLHRPATDDEIREICGPEIAAAYRVVNHDARDLSSHRHLGSTASGTPVYIDERFIAADLHITLGFIEPHLMLGYSGGRKLIAPGLAAQETIKVLHSPKFMRDAALRRRLDRGQSAASRTARDRAHGPPRFPARRGAHPRPRDRRRLSPAIAERRTARGVEFVSQVMLETLDEPADAAITTSAGYPLDLTYYQAIKGVTAAAHIVKPGGTILLAAACQEGAGAPEFCRMLRRRIIGCRVSGSDRRRSGGRRPVAAREARAGDHAAQAALVRPGPARRVSCGSVGPIVRDDRIGDRRAIRVAARGRECRGNSGRAVRARESARARSGRRVARLNHFANQHWV